MSYYICHLQGQIAGGKHKQRRGFLAKSRTSLHRWYEPRLNEIIRAWLPKVNILMKEELDATNAELPFELDTSP